jgi:hypothetical protein
MLNAYRYKVKFRHKILAKNLIFTTEDNVPGCKLKEKITKFFSASFNPLKRKEVESGSGSISRGTDPHQNVTDPQHCDDP